MRDGGLHAHTAAIAWHVHYASSTHKAITTRGAAGSDGKFTLVKKSEMCTIGIEKINLSCCAVCFQGACGGIWGLVNVN